MDSIVNSFLGQMDSHPQQHPLVIFYDLKTDHISDNVHQTVDYQETFEPFKLANDNAQIVELVAVENTKGSQFEKHFYSADSQTITKEKYFSVFCQFLQWMNSARTEDQRIILVAHNNQFFHYHIFTSIFLLLGGSIPDYIYFFDSMNLVKKFLFIDPMLESTGINECSEYFLKRSLNNQHQLYHNLEERICTVAKVCDITSRQLGYDKFEHYLEDNVNETWKDLKIEEEFEPQWSTIKWEKKNHENGAWILCYNYDVLAEKWKQAITLYRGGCLTGISSMKVCTMKDPTGSSEYSGIQGIWFYCSSPGNNEKHIKDAGRNLLVNMDYSHNSGYMRYNSEKNRYRMAVPWAVPKCDPFQKGQIFLHAQKRYVKRLKHKIKTLIAIFARVKNSISDTSILCATDGSLQQLELSQNELTETYEQMHKKLDYMSKEYENGSAEKRLEFAKEEAHMTIDYMKRNFDTLHHFFHREINELLQYWSDNILGIEGISSLNSSAAIAWIKNGRFWCIRCTDIQDICKSCIRTYFTLPDDRIMYILRMANSYYEDATIDDDYSITLEELRKIKILLFYEGFKNKMGFKADDFNLFLKAFNLMINERLQLLVTTESDLQIYGDNTCAKAASQKQLARDLNEIHISNLLKNVEDGSQQLKQYTTELKKEMKRNEEILRGGSAVVSPAEVPISPNNPTEEDKLTKMKQRKEAKKERAKKKVKTVIVEENEEIPYDFEKVLESLGETGAKEKPISSTNVIKSKVGKKSKRQNKRTIETAKDETTTTTANDETTSTTANNETSNEILPALSELGASNVVLSEYDIQNATSMIETPLSELGATNETESNHQNDIENTSSLLATSVGDTSKSDDTDGSKHTKEQNKQITFEAVKKEDKSHRKSTTTANDATTNSDIPLSESSTSKSKRKKSKKHHKKTQNETATYETTFNEVLLPELGASKVVLVSESNPHQNDIEKASSLIVTPLPELGARNTSESNHRIDIEHDTESLLLATSGASGHSKEEGIPLEVFHYLENVEKENQAHKESIESLKKSLKKPMEYMEKIMKKYENLKVKTQELEDARLCKICMEAEICFVFIPCGHICTCENCAVNGDLKNCPICREKISKRMKTFMP